jgi:hypothetical protein
MTTEEQPTPPPEPGEEELDTGIDFTDPLKRDSDDDDEDMPGLDPVVTLPPE